MQLKGLVRFFTIVLVLISVYMLSFTWFVRSHESKLQARAKKYVLALYPQAKKYKSADDYPDSIKTVYDARLRRLEDRKGFGQARHRGPRDPHDRRGIEHPRALEGALLVQPPAARQASDQCAMEFHNGSPR